MSATDVSPSALTPAEVDQLAADEAIIEAGQAIFMKVGMALARIRDARLYRATHDTFADYVDQRWGFTRIRAYQLIEAGVVAASMSTMVDTPEIENERQARALAPIVKESGPEAGAEVLREVAESDEKVTAKAIKAKVEAKAKKPKGFHKNPLLEQIEAGIVTDQLSKKPDGKPKVTKPKDKPVTPQDIAAMPLGYVSSINPESLPEPLQDAIFTRMSLVWALDEAVQSFTNRREDEWREIVAYDLAPDYEDVKAATGALVNLLRIMSEPDATEVQ